MNEEEKLLSGHMYCPLDPMLKALKLKAHNLSVDYSKLHEDDIEERATILKQLFPDMGEGNFFQGPIYIHYGVHTHIGNYNFFNFTTTIQDDTNVYIGDHNDFGPNLTIVTPMHPIIQSERQSLINENGERQRLCYALPVHIGSGCWFGANVVILPGVTIGDNCVIGGGAVVTKDIPSNHVAVGNPCKVLHEISEKDSMKYKPEFLGDCKVE